MPQTLSIFPFGRAQPPQPSPEMVELQRELNRCSVQLHQAYLSFNSTCEVELVESYVFEINALHARYNYLLRRIKELGGGA